MAPIRFDETLIEAHTLLKEQLINTGVFYDYLCSNYIDLRLVDRTARELFGHLLELKRIITYAFDLNADNSELAYLTQYYSTFLDFEMAKPLSFRARSKNLAKRMLLA